MCSEAFSLLNSSRKDRHVIIARLFEIYERFFFFDDLVKKLHSEYSVRKACVFNVYNIYSWECVRTDDDGDGGDMATGYIVRA